MGGGSPQQSIYAYCLKWLKEKQPPHYINGDSHMIFKTPADLQQFRSWLSNIQSDTHKFPVFFFFFLVFGFCFISQNHPNGTLRYYAIRGAPYNFEKQVMVPCAGVNEWVPGPVYDNQIW